MNRLFNKLISIPLILALLFVNPAMAQGPVRNYEAEWKKVQAFIDKGLPKSALDEVKKIYALAKKEKQDAQLIKSLIFMSDLQTENRENHAANSIAELEKEIAQSREPVTSLLKSLLAGKYWDYFQQNRWRLYDRTKTVGFVKTDIATWDAENFHQRISELFLQSIKEERLLQQTKLQPYDAIIVKGNMRHLRPTLYDLVAFRALNYFTNDEKDIKKPAYAFEIDQAYAFDPAAEFIKRKFPTKDSLSLQHKALLIYQRLLAFHLNDTKPDALIDAEIHRIRFIKTNSVHPDKDRLYFSALNQIAQKYKDLPAASQAWFLMAEYHNELAVKYKPYGDTTYRYERLKAKTILEKIISRRDSSEGRVNAVNLLRDINSKHLRFAVEKVNVPGQAFRAFVEYKNFTNLYLRVIKADEKLKMELENQYDEKYWTRIVAANPVKTWQQSLPSTNDMQQHNVEIKIDGLAAGEYILLASPDKDMADKRSILGARFFYVSNISYVNSTNDFFIMNRDNGQPLAKAAVQVWEQKYDYTQSKYIRTKGKTYESDANGLVRMERRKDNSGYGNSYLLEVSHGNDKLFMNELAYDNYYYRDPASEESKITTSVFLFTDRSLYRPGQTVYFKGIVLFRNEKEKQSGIRNDYQTTIILRDANYKDADTIRVSTNEFGSFSGKFQLPQAGMNGQFSIYTKKDPSQASFRVEEYKRPKFYVEYEPIKGVYKVNDKIKVTGVAKAYAGNNIDGAIVKYRVVRQPRFIYPWLFWRWWQPPSDPMEIAHGEIKTDKDGKFFIDFTAIPDLTLDRKFEPVFDYTIYADVTDINGETRSGEKKVSVSYKSLMMVSYIPERLATDSLKILLIHTQNMNGEHEPATVKVTISKLKEEKRLIRARYWERPDQFVMSKQEYIRNFPYDEYDNEADYKSWEKGQQVFSKTDSARANGQWILSDSRSTGNGKFAPGFYVIEMETKDKNGEIVKDIKYIELYDEKASQLNRPEYLWTGTSKTTVEPGESAKIELGTAADNLFIVYQKDKGNLGNMLLVSPEYSFLQLNNEKRSYNYPITESDRGGFGVGWMFIKHNRVYQLNQTINIPWSNKNLTIEYATYRDKTLPGSEEKWKLRISGYKKEKVAAEMLASMYDASLDQFYPHSWRSPYIWTSYYNGRTWDGRLNFSEITSNERYGVNEEEVKYVDKRYDNLFYEEDIIPTGYYNRMPKRMAMATNGHAPSPDQERMKDGDDVVEKKKVLNEVTVTTTDQPQKTEGSGDVKIRKNFNETVFFFPDLRTDSSGAIEFSFTMPEALTKWKFMAIAHTKDGAFGNSTKEIVTQKELMVQPNAPRFLREGDKMEFSSKIVNLSNKELNGTAELQLVDATTNQPVDGWFKNVIPNQYFTVAAGSSELVKFPIEVPYLFNKALVWRIVAKAGNYSDGEENAMPVLTNRMLVTETMPLPMRGTGTKDFTFTKLLNAASSETLQHFALTLEYTSNPSWYAVQALPYLMEYPYECAEQTWNRYYANSLASFISNSSPRIKQVFERWKIKDTAALMSNLQKNQELKSVLLEETPWVLQAKNEAEQKKNIALLFDMVRMSNELNNAYEKLKQMQSSNGGFVWFKGGPDDRYITQYITTGIGHLKKLNGIANGQDLKLKAILNSAIPYLDRKLKEDYDYLIKYKVDLKQKNIGYIQVQYLYMRSFFPEYKIDPASKTAYDYYFKQAQQYWVKDGKYMQGMIALALFRSNDTKTPADILASLKETSITNEELGMYWKDQRSGWFWHEAPIETHSLLIEAFQEAGKDKKAVDDLRTWLLKNKQTNNWKTTKATAEACYALLLQGTDWLSSEPVVTVSLGNTAIKSTDNQQEAGTGYFKQTIQGEKVKPEMGNIKVNVSSNSSNVSATWGGVYWQYFEDLDKITTAATPLSLSKKLFIEMNTDRGPVITPVNEGGIIKIGDKVKVRVELRVDRDMEYVHMKDMRAAAMEPVNVLSTYKYQGGLGYYESTKDASTNFFFSYLRKGTYVFEYTLFATHAGNFSNGITTIQCMYAPEFSSHSEGIRINIE